MERQVLAFFIITFLAMMIMVGLSFYSWRRRPAKCARTLSMLFLSNTVWMGAILAGLLVQTEKVSYFWSVIRMTGVFASPVFWLILSLQYSGNDKRLRSFFYFILWIIPVFSLVLMISNNSHHLFLTEIIYERHGPFLVDVKWVLGPWFPLHTAYSYSLVLLGVYFFIREALRLASRFLWQAVSMFTAALIPLAVNIIYVFHLIPGLIVNFDPLGFVFSGIIFSASLFRFRLLDIVPVARRFLVDNMHDGVLVIDYDKRVIDINPEALRILGVSLNEVLCNYAVDFLPELPSPADSQTESSTDININGSVFDLRSTPLVSGREAVGHLLVMRDITRQKQLEQQLRELAQTDPLTGILNRRQFFNLAGDEFARASRYNHTVSVLMIDCDRFKLINDNLGHHVGDQVLIRIAEICTETIRETDILGRYGGEEFIILSPETPLNDAALLAERLRKAIETMNFRHDNIHIPVTISIGLASVNGHDLVTDNAVDTLIEQADNALYMAKEAGRNCSQIYRCRKTMT